MGTVSMDYEANFRRRCAEMEQLNERLYRYERIILLHSSGLCWLSTCLLRMSLWWNHHPFWVWKAYVWGAKRLMGWASE